MTTSPSITINKIQVWAGYEFDQEDCKFCRCSLSAPPLQDLNNNSKKNIEMCVAQGKCGHLFHKSCIKELSKNNFVSCQVCNLVWKEDGEPLDCEIAFQEEKS
jgi:hypothetical protein